MKLDLASKFMFMRPVGASRSGSSSGDSMQGDRGLVSLQLPARRRSAPPRLMLFVVLGVVVAVAMWSGRAGADIIASLEEPGLGAGVSGVGNIRGWAFSTDGALVVSPISVFIDGVESISVPCCSSRADVKSAFPQAPRESGFSGAFNWGLLNDGAHVVRVVIRDSNGKSVELTAGFQSHRFGGATFVSEFDADNDGLGFCYSCPSRPNAEELGSICCDSFRIVGGDGKARICDQVRFELSVAAQGMAMVSPGTCTPLK
jgi:hypothetical protein